MTAIRRTAACALALLAVSAAAARAAQRALPAGVGRSIDALFTEWSGRNRPGCAVGVARDGTLVFGRGYGMADLEHGVPIDPRTVFDVGSVSKQFTAASIALLALDGKLDLDDDVRRFVPEVPDYGAKITIRHLLHHGGGLRDYTTLMALAGDDVADLTTTGEALAMLGRQRGVDFAPGERFEYSNTGYFLLGLVVERAAGMPLSRFAEERLFAPLGMTSTHVHDDHLRVVPHRAQGYEERDGRFGIDMSDWEQVGDGSVFTTVEDLARWMGNLETGKVGGPRFAELMASPGLPTAQGDGSTYGFGLFGITWSGRPAQRHGGAWAGYRAQVLHVPWERLGVAVLCNFSRQGWLPLGPKVDAVAAAVLGEEPPPPPPAPPSPAPDAAAADTTASSSLSGRLEPFAGRYWSDELATTWELAVRDGALVRIGHDAHPSALTPMPAAANPPAAVAGAALAVPRTMDWRLDGWMTLHFVPRPDGEVEGFEMRLDSGDEAATATERPGIAFRRIDPQPRALLIVNARVIDGTGASARTGSLRIVGDRIAAVGDVPPQPDDEVFDAHGLVLAPGFIDTHSHADSDLLAMPEALAAVSQGITTVVGGQDGDSPFPLAAFFAKLDAAPAAVNLAAYSGHGTLRDQVLGKDYKRIATSAEVAKMAKLLERDLETGALGLSTGLEYDPGIYSSRDEVLALAKVAARHGGRYISHVRSEDRHFWEAIDEILTIGREAKLPVQISHVKLAMRSWWGQAPRLLALLDGARKEGIDVTADIYPYLYWHSGLTVLFPARDFDDLAESRRVLAEIAPADGLLLGHYLPNPSYANRTVADIAKERGEAPEVTLLALIHDAEAMRAQGRTDVEDVIGTSMVEGDLEKLLAWPHTNLCTDGQLDGSHPRGFGTYPRVLGRYVRERGVLSLEEAVRRMTSLAADHVGIERRGRVVPGAFADLVLFDPATVIDRATTSDPHALSAGIERVWVNGRPVYANGSATGLRPGRVLRRAP
ncbi:MAG TPA: serine hydrolase [Thermoanaerobaculia bacterium]|jgi:N-acyl-D-amino-acid deacylase|nr:serine hydrolase [Thermoanaerobaculia bacterium]